MRDVDKSSWLQAVDLLPVSRRFGDWLSISPGAVCGRDTEIERSEVSPGLSEMYKIHLARFSGIDVERVTIYVSPFLHGEKRRRETMGRRWPLGSRRNLIDRKRGWDIGSEIGLDRWSVTVLTLAYREIRIQPVLAATGLSRSFYRLVRASWRLN